MTFYFIFFLLHLDGWTRKILKDSIHFEIQNKQRKKIAHLALIWVFGKAVILVLGDGSARLSPEKPGDTLQGPEL